MACNQLDPKFGILEMCNTLYKQEGGGVGGVLSTTCSFPRVS